MYYLIVFLIFLLVIFGGLSVYSYVDIKEETDNSIYAKNISLANLIICFLFAIIISVLLFMRYLSMERLCLITLFILLVSSVLFILGYYFLEEERTDINLEENKRRTNIEFLTLDLVLAIVGFAFFLLFCGYSYGKMEDQDKTDHKMVTNGQTLIIDNLDKNGDNNRIKKVLIM